MILVRGLARPAVMDWDSYALLIALLIWCPCLLGADWSLRSDVMANSRLQAHSDGSTTDDDLVELNYSAMNLISLAAGGEGKHYDHVVYIGKDKATGLRCVRFFGISF